MRRRGKYNIKIFRAFFSLSIIISLTFALSCSRKTEYPQEIRDLQIAVEKAPNDTALYNDLIKALFEKGYYKGALEYSQKLQTLETDSLPGIFYSASCYEKMEIWDKASEYYRKLCSASPEDCRGYYGIGVLDYKKGQYQKSAEYIEKAIASSTLDTPEYIKIMIFLAEAYYYNNNLEKAYLILEKALELDPFNEDALYNFGMWKLKEGKYSEAIELLEKLVAQNPQDSLPYLRLGKAYYHKKEMGLAEKAFWNASRFDSTIETLAKIVHIENFESTYKEVNTAVVKVTEEYHYREGGTYYVRGIIENLGLELARWVTVVARFYDRRNKVITQKVFDVSPRNLGPGQYAFFKIAIPYSENIFDVKVKPNWHKRSVSVYLN